MAKRRYKKSRHVKAKPSLLSMVPVAVVGAIAYNGYQAGGVKSAVADPVAAVTGYGMISNTFELQRMIPFWGAVAGTYVAKKLVSASGVNRGMKGLPFRL